MMAGVALALLTATSGAPGVHTAQVAAVREIIRAGSGYVCLSIDAGTLPSGATQSAHLRSAQARIDPPPAIMAQLRTPGVTFFPSSHCVRTDLEWDIVHRDTGKPAMLLGIGRVENLSATRIRVVVYTNSGFLTGTFTQLDIAQINGVWTVVSSDILLQE